MKTKRGLYKKFELNKNTIANLDNRELHKVNGGWTGPTQVTVCMTNCVSGCPVCEGTLRGCGDTATCDTLMTCATCTCP